MRRGSTPGTFHYSVLDNGVTSKEYWRIIGREGGSGALPLEPVALAAAAARPVLWQQQ